MNCPTTSGGIHVEPRRTSISPACKSVGCAAVSASTFTAYGPSGSAVCAAFASASFSRTLPERYSSAVTYALSWASAPPMFRKMTPRSFVASSSSLMPESSDMKARSTRARSPMETANASSAVSTWVTVCCARMVRLVNISALALKAPFSSSSSREQSSG